MTNSKKPELEIFDEALAIRQERVLLHGEIFLLARFRGLKTVAGAIWTPGAKSLSSVVLELEGYWKSRVGQSPDVLKVIGAAAALEKLPRSASIPLSFVPKEGDLDVVLFAPEGRAMIALRSQPAHSISTPHLDQKTRPVSLYILDDSATVRMAIRKLLSEDPRIQIVGESGDPAAAIEEIVELAPDVLSLDLHMPKMNGVEVLAELSQRRPTPALILSGLSKEEGSLVMQALSMGAFDFVKKPSWDDLAELGTTLREKIVLAGASRTVATPTGSRALYPWKSESLILIGASTGGTRAIEELLKLFPKEIPPVLIVQHIPAVFSKAFADRLNGLLPFEVREAASGDLVVPNRVLIAPGGSQMGLKGDIGRLSVTVCADPPMNGFAPSVDYLFLSAAKKKLKTNVIAMLLTGMGKDGAKGLLELRRVGVRTLAQDEASCVVFGMPREAIRLEAAEFVEPLQAMPGRIDSIFHKTAA